MTVAPHQRVDRGALELGQRVVDDRLRTVAVGDHRRGTGAGERVTERTDGRVVETFGVLLHQGVEPEVHEPTGRGNPVRWR